MISWNRLLRMHLSFDVYTLKDFVIITYSTTDQGVISRTEGGGEDEIVIR